MQIPVVVETVSTGQFRAQGLPPFTAVAEGATSDEALAKLREQLNQEVKAGKLVVVGESPLKKANPFLAMAGSLKDNPLLDEWKAAMEEYRRECDVEAGIDLSKRNIRDFASIPGLAVEDWSK
jgi:hypothetical protein